MKRTGECQILEEERAAVRGGAKDRDTGEGELAVPL